MFSPFLRSSVTGGIEICLLAGAGLRAVGDRDLVLAGLLGVARLLGSHGDTTVLGGLHANGLERAETKRVRISQVQWGSQVERGEGIGTLLLA